MNVIYTDIPEVLIFEPTLFGDRRVFSCKTYQFRRYAEHGISRPFIQDNISRSSYGVLRGLHVIIRTSWVYAPQGTNFFVLWRDLRASVTSCASSPTSSER
jgi:dTDP-4-dehydrorhamnose 3,5-epimerase-like enzyme